MTGVAGRGTGGARAERVRLRTARGRSASSQRWLHRQLNDPYVQEARRLGYRSRAAFKLLQLDERFGLLRPGMRVVDLGAAPGGWTQVATARVGSSGLVIALDMVVMDPVAGALVLEADFMEEAGLGAVLNALSGTADLVLSDMAAPTTGHAPTDHLRTSALCEAAYDLAEQVLAPDGAFVAKVFRGGSEAGLLDRMKRSFATVRHAKPDASRPRSPETYVVARGFRGPPAAEQP